MDKPPEEDKQKTPPYAAELGASALRLGNDEPREVVPPVFRLGNGNRLEYLEDGERILTWQLTGNEGRMAELAGWQSFPHKLTDAVGYLRLPEGTRNAQSILSGTEAYTDEKARIIQAACAYLQNVRQKLDSVDTSFSWQSVGVTPEEGTVFMAPPNILVPQTDTVLIEAWAREAAEELRLLLANDSKNQTLIDMFERALR